MKENDWHLNGKTLLTDIIYCKFKAFFWLLFFFYNGLLQDATQRIYKVKYDYGDIQVL